MKNGKKAKILVIGANGMLGKVLVKQASKDFEVTATMHSKLDITCREQTEKIFDEVRPDIAVLTAGITDVDKCENDPVLANRVNVEGSKNIAEAAKKVNAPLISLSTDYVFDGETTRPYKEDDETNPISVYGVSKLRGEKAVSSLLKNYVIVRSSRLFGEGERGFASFVLNAISQKKPIKAVCDKEASPTYILDLADALCKIAGLIAQGKYDFDKYSLLHVVNSGSCSWYEMAKFIVDELKIDGVDLIKVNMSEFSFVAKRPKNSALDNSKYKVATGHTLRTWQEALKAFLQQS